MHITVSLTLKVVSNPINVTLYFTLVWNRWNVWFGMKSGSEPPGCILYLISFSSEYTWVLLNRPNGHWLTPGQTSNTLFKSHLSQAQDFWTRSAMPKTAWFNYSRDYKYCFGYMYNKQAKTAWFIYSRGCAYCSSYVYNKQAITAWFTYSRV